MEGIILNEEGYVTYPFTTFQLIEDYVRSLNCRIMNVQYSDPEAFSFIDWGDTILSGDELYSLLKKHPDVQWWWGVIAVFEMIAFDSSETYVMTDDSYVADILREHYPNAENFEKYVFD